MKSDLFTSQALGAIVSIAASFLILFTLALVFAGSWVMFWLLAVRSTAQRTSIGLIEWGKERGFRQQKVRDDELPPPLNTVTQQRLEIRSWLSGKGIGLIQCESLGTVSASSLGDREARAGTWNLLLRELQVEWPPTGLRPVSAPFSVLELFSLTSFPLLGSSARFMIYGTAVKAATALSRSAARGLLPADVGLLLHGKRLVLDFSNRPFDTVEFERMLAVAEQILNHLPQPSSGE